MKQPISSDRAQLSHLLTRLVEAPEDNDLRYRAAKLALRVSLDENDLSASDLLDNLLSRPPSSTGLPISQQDLYLRATARAVRRAIVSAKRKGHQTSPRHTLNQTCNDPMALEELIRSRIEVGQLQVAQSISRVGILRHPDESRFEEIQEEISHRLQATLLPAPIPFPAPRH